MNARATREHRHKDRHAATADTADTGTVTVSAETGVVSQASKEFEQAVRDREEVCTQISSTTAPQAYKPSHNELYK